MEIQHNWTRAEYLFIRNVCSEDELRLCKNELEILSFGLETPEKTRSATHEDGRLKKQNRGVFFSEMYALAFSDCSPCMRVIDEVIRIVRSDNYTPHSTINYIAHNFLEYDLLFSAYSNGDYYEAHRDQGTLTLLFWVKNKDFVGGNLKFTDFDEEILFEDNSIIIFPSHYQHEVSKVNTSEDGYVRYVVSAFLRPVLSFSAKTKEK